MTLQSYFCRPCLQQEELKAQRDCVTRVSDLERDGAGTCAVSPQSSALSRAAPAYPCTRAPSVVFFSCPQTSGKAIVHVCFVQEETEAQRGCRAAMCPHSWGQSRGSAPVLTIPALLCTQKLEAPGRQNPLTDGHLAGHKGGQSLFKCPLKKLHFPLLLSCWQPMSS